VRELPAPAKKGPPLTWITIGLLGCSIVFYTLSAVFVAVSSNTDDDSKSNLSAQAKKQAVTYPETFG
jgi:flagellar basal body-associated protein FliL